MREELSLTAPVESMQSFSVGADVPSLAVEKTNLPGVSPTEPPFASTSPSINAYSPACLSPKTILPIVWSVVADVVLYPRISASIAADDSLPPG